MENIDGLKQEIATLKAECESNAKSAQYSAETNRELVPPRKSAEDYVDVKFSNRDLAAIWNSCVSEILRNIEGQSK